MKISNKDVRNIAKKANINKDELFNKLRRCKSIGDLATLNLKIFQKAIIINSIMNIKTK